MACSREILFSSFTYLCVCVRIIYSLTEDKPFEYFILLTIFVNCILLAANTPLPENDKSDLNQKLVSINFEIVRFFCNTEFRVVLRSRLLHLLGLTKVNHSLTLVIVTCYSLGRCRNIFISNILPRSRIKNCSSWICTTHRLVPTERMERIGLRRRCDRVCTSVYRMHVCIYMQHNACALYSTMYVVVIFTRKFQNI